MHHFTGFDWVILVILLVSVGVGFFRGFIREAMSLVSLILAILCALKFSPGVSSWFVPVFDSEAVRYMAAFASIAVVIMLLGFVIGRVFKTLLSVTGFGIVDRGMGLCFGAVRGLLCVTVLLMLLSMTAMGQSAWLAQSDLAPRFTGLVKWCDRFLPDQLNHVSSWVSEHPTGQHMQHLNKVKQVVDKHITK